MIYCFIIYIICFGELTFILYINNYVKSPKKENTNKNLLYR